MMKTLIAPISEPIIQNGQVSQAWLVFFNVLANAIDQIHREKEQ